MHAKPRYHLRSDSARRGVVSILAMLFLVIFSSLAAAMAVVSHGNLLSSQSYQGVNRALAAAETGMSLFRYRVNKIVSDIFTEKGTIEEDQADALWPDIRDGIIRHMGNDPHNLDNYSSDNEHIALGRVPISDEPDAPTFQIVVERHPVRSDDYDHPDYRRGPYSIGGGTNRFTTDGEPVSAANPVRGWWVRVRVIGRDRHFARSVRYDFRIDKKVRFAILSRNRVMIGRNVFVRGAIASTYQHTRYKHGHPVQIANDFQGLDPELDERLDGFTRYLSVKDINGDNRIRLEDERESSDLDDAESYDRNGDGFVDAYDFFLLKYDTDNDGAVVLEEFSDSGGGMYSRQLWQVINESKYPQGTRVDWTTLRVREPGNPWTDAAADLSVINNADRYAKIAGRIALLASKVSWETGAANGPYQRFLRGPICPGRAHDPLAFEASDLADAVADEFDVTEYRELAVGELSSQASSPKRNDRDRPAGYTLPSLATIESVPFNSPHPYDYYIRPVYLNIVFTDVTIPKGTNALFVNCRFVGVTFVDTHTDNADPNYNYAGMQNPDGSQRFPAVTATVDDLEYRDTKPLSNNVRFENCTFEGVVVTEAPEQFTHVRNKLQFTGTTRFDLNAPSLSHFQRRLFRKSTVFAPQYSVDMGSFSAASDPNEAVKLEGTIVAGVFDIRGQATIEGSLVTTYEPRPDEGPLSYGGSPAAFNTTLGYFESAEGDNEAELPAEGWGRIILRYDPDRAMPDGIVSPIEFRADAATYAEGGR